MSEIPEIPEIDTSQISDEYVRGPDGFVQSMTGFIVSDRVTYNVWRGIGKALCESEDLRDAIREEAEKQVPCSIQPEDIIQFAGVIEAVIQICNMTQDAAEKAEAGDHG